MGWFWSSATTESSAKVPAASSNSNPAQCPIDHSKFSKESDGPVCPVKSDTGEFINPMNNMPYTISVDKAPGQQIDLPTERTFSTIPRGETDDQGVWEYPSPQQMFNAMIRKGKGDVPEDAVESMVNIHNFLNEGAWSEILTWEEKHTKETNIEPRLLKFTGRPHDLSPRARMYSILGSIMPGTFDSTPPFDRHDWTVLRADGQGNWNKVRYVIDYYGGPEDEDGMPTFFLDVRPALDNFTNIADRADHWIKETKPVWDKALGRSS